MAKIKKSFLKRFKLTRKGKIIRRIIGQSHFFAKKDSSFLRRKRKLKTSSDLVLDYKYFS